MNVKKLVKVANYYDVKYGLKKEAGEYEDLKDLKVFVPRIGQELWSDEYVGYMKWDGRYWVPQRRDKPIDPEEYSDYYNTDLFPSSTSGTRFFDAVMDKDTGELYTVHPQTGRKIPLKREVVEEKPQKTWQQTFESNPENKSIADIVKDYKYDDIRPQREEFGIYGPLKQLEAYRAVMQEWEKRTKKQPSSGGQIGAANAPKKPAAPFKPNKANWQKFQPRLSEVKQSIDLFLGRNPTSTTLQKQKQRLMFLNQQALSGKDIDADLKRLESEAIYYTPAKRTKEPEESKSSGGTKDSSANKHEEFVKQKYETADNWKDADNLPT